MTEDNISLQILVWCKDKYLSIALDKMDLSKKKGKTGTRGNAQIAKENVETIQFYRNMILGSNGIYFVVMTLLGAQYRWMPEIAMFVISFILYIGGFQFLFRLGTPKTTEPDGKGQLLDPGLVSCS